MTNSRDRFKDFEAATRQKVRQKWVLTLYVAGISPRSQQAIRSVKEVCERHLKGWYELEVVDIYQHPEVLKNTQIVAAPTLVKELPPPLRRLIGDMTNTERLILGLDLRPIDEQATQ